MSGADYFESREKAQKRLVAELGLCAHRLRTLAIESGAEEGSIEITVEPHLWDYFYRCVASSPDMRIENIVATNRGRTGFQFHGINIAMRQAQTR